MMRIQDAKDIMEVIRLTLNVTNNFLSLGLSLCPAYRCTKITEKNIKMVENTNEFRSMSINKRTMIPLVASQGDNSGNCLHLGH